MIKANFKKLFASTIAVMTVALNAVGMSASAAGATPSNGKWKDTSNSSNYIEIKSSTKAYCKNV